MKICFHSMACRIFLKCNCGIGRVNHSGKQFDISELCKIFFKQFPDLVDRLPAVDQADPGGVGLQAATVAGAPWTGTGDIVTGAGADVTAATCTGVRAASSRATK